MIDTAFNGRAVLWDCPNCGERTRSFSWRDTMTCDECGREVELVVQEVSGGDNE